MTGSGVLVHLRVLPPPDTPREELHALAEQVRAGGADADVEAVDNFIGVGEVALALAVTAVAAEGARIVLYVLDQLRGKVGYTLDTRERPPLLSANPALPPGVGHLIWPDGRVETADTRPSAAKVLELLLSKLPTS